MSLVDADDGQDRGIIEGQFEPADHLDRLGIGHAGDCLAGRGFEHQPDRVDPADLQRHLPGNLAQGGHRLVDVSRRRQQHVPVAIVAICGLVLVDRRQQRTDRLDPFRQWPGANSQRLQQLTGLFQGERRRGL